MPQNPPPHDDAAQNRPPVVLHLAQPVEGGVATVVTDLVRAQRADGLTVHLGCPPSGDLPHHAHAAGADVHPWPARRGPGPELAAEVWRVRRLVRALRPDVVHLHSAKAGLAGRLALHGRVPTVFQPHAWSFEAVDGTTAALSLRWERLAARWAHRLLCVSEDERRRGEAAGITGRWAVVPNGVDLTRFPGGGPAARQAARAALALSTAVPVHDPLVVCVGRLCRQKGQDVLLRAWRRVTARHPHAALVLVGDGPDRAALQRAAPASVHFAGPSDRVRLWYEAADLVVLPSRWEGMALAPLEAMACGRPVLLTEVAGAADGLPPAQRETHLVPPDDPVALATALVRLLADRESTDRAGRAAQEHVRTGFDVRLTAAAVLDLYRGLLGLPHPHSRERLAR
ncbi:glycosyltransferase [Streptomyces durbertensis]|uniref:Glycosyltransferase n=1 Tax=Streptomyces durbertensis TaxID=2448886 RepID=A0ABR6EG18_9ACTN|nr:glycosyltransferase [Streptomyces durbertensis]MBB1244022.1 glycosyltransferase [Streptomyces durbertensis]